MDDYRRRWLSGYNAAIADIKSGAIRKVDNNIAFALRSGNCANVWYKGYIAACEGDDPRWATAPEPQ